MPTYKVDIPGQGSFEVESHGELTDAQAFEQAKNQQPKSSFVQETEKMPPAAEEPWEMQAARGIMSGGEEIIKAGTQYLPGPEVKAFAAPAEGEVTGSKVKEGKHTEPTAISTAASMLPTGAVAGAAARALPKAAGAMTRAAVGGAVGGAIQPVEGGNFWETKAEQVAFGASLGFGFGVAGQPAAAGTNAIMRWVGRKFNPETLEDAAVGEVLGRINNANKYGSPSATDMLDLISKSDKPMTLADVGGEPVKGLAGRAYRSGPAGKQVASGFLEARDEGAYMRLLADVGQHINSGPAMYDAVEGINTAQQAASQPLYRQSDALQNIWSPRLGQFFKVSALQKGLAKGFRLEELESTGQNRPFNAHILGVDLDPNNPEAVILSKQPNLRVLDMGKRGLDAMIAEHRGIDGRLDAEGRALSIFRKGYMDEIDALDKSGIYKKARETWGGYQAAKDAIHFGRSVFGGMSPEEIQAEFGAMTKGDQEYARLGMADMLRERLAKTGFNNDESVAILKNDWMKRQMRPFFKSPEDYEKFVEKVIDERTMKKTMSSVMKGSQSQERAVEDNMAHPALRALSAIKIAWGVGHGNILRTVGESWRLYHDFAKSGKIDPAYEAEVAKVLFAPDLSKTPPGIRFMQKVAEQELAKAAPKGSGAAIQPPTPGVVPGALAGSATEHAAPRQDIMSDQQ